MKKILAGAALVALTATTAQAADLARKAPVYKAPILQVYDWTGFYIGVNAGGGVARDRTTQLFNTLSGERSHLSPAGGIAGGQVGYNWQFRNFYNLVLGVEADIQGSDQKDSFTCGLGCIPLANPNASQKIDWFGTARARVGIATGPVLTYVTGGYAYGNYKSTTTGVVGVPFVQTINTTKGGYTFGSGVEAQLGGNWTGKVEYLYVRLEGTGQAGVLAPGLAGYYSTRVEDHIFRAGLNYNFNNNAGYVAPVANWSGFYLGGNAGSVIGRDRSTLALAGGIAPRFNLVPQGFTGGGQIGYNWQAGSWVFGVEGDFQGMGAKDTQTCVLFCAGGLGVIPQQKLEYLATARGRIGYSVGSTLFYGTAGYAYGQTKTRLYEAPLFSTVELKRSKGGYVVGGGMETPLTFLGFFGPQWTTTTEYLYVDLGRSNYNFTTAGLGAQTFSTQTREHIFRSGINYHFNTPVVAKY